MIGAVKILVRRFKLKVNYAPLVSGVSGRFGGQVFTQWRGIDVVRSFTPPAQPRTPAQLAVRNAFSAGNAFYESGIQQFVDAWEDRRGSSAGTGRNIFVGSLIRSTQGETDLDAFEIIEGAAQFPAPVVTVTAGSAQLTPAVTPPTPPTGFTISGYLRVVIGNFDPHAAFVQENWNSLQLFAATEADIEAAITGLTASQEYQVSIAAQYTRTSDMSIFYSSGGQVTGTPT